MEHELLPPKWPKLLLHQRRTEGNGYVFARMQQRDNLDEEEAVTLLPAKISWGQK